MLATGVGSWPGTEFAPAQRLTFGELSDRPYLVELPGRGVGADLIGRAVAAIDGLGFDLQPSGWRLAGAPGADQRRARGLLRRDLDELEEIAQGYRGPFTVTLAGPWTLAAAVEKPRGDKALADRGARRELAEALAEAASGLLGELTRRLPGAELSLQLDEPSLPAVAAGRIGTASGFGRHRAVHPPELSEGISTVLAGAKAAPALVHCCAPGAPIELILGAGAGGVLVDPRLLGRAGRDALGAALEAGAEVRLAVADTATPDVVPRPDALARTALEVLGPLGLDPERAAAGVLTPGCGLAGWGVGPATALLRALVAAAAIVDDELHR